MEEASSDDDEDLTTKLLRVLEAVVVELCNGFENLVSEFCCKWMKKIGLNRPVMRNQIGSVKSIEQNRGMMLGYLNQEQEIQDIPLVEVEVLNQKV